MLQLQTPHDEDDDDAASDAGEDEGDGTRFHFLVPAVAHTSRPQMKTTSTMTMTPISRRKWANPTGQPSIRMQVRH